MGLSAKEVARLAKRRPDVINNCADGNVRRLVDFFLEDLKVGKVTPRDSSVFVRAFLCVVRLLSFEGDDDDRLNVAASAPARSGTPSWPFRGPPWTVGVRA